jgi:hypothetical protein
MRFGIGDMINTEIEKEKRKFQGFSQRVGDGLWGANGTIIGSLRSTSLPQSTPLYNPNRIR